MDLLNIGFALLVVKIALCVLPGVVGLFLLISSEESKRNLRNSVCNVLFGVSNAIPSKDFNRTLYIIGSIAIVFSFVASWFLLLRKFF